jgi:hypothetical protein
MDEASTRPSLSVFAWEDLRERIARALPRDRPLRLEHPLHGAIHHGEASHWQVIDRFPGYDHLTLSVAAEHAERSCGPLPVVTALIDAARESESLSGELVATYAALAALDDLGRR